MADDARVPPHEPFVLVMRHGRHTAGSLTESGEAGVSGVGERFAEWLDATYRRHPAVELELWEMDSPEGRATADLLIDTTQRALAALSEAHSAASHPRLTVH